MVIVHYYTCYKELKQTSSDSEKNVHSVSLYTFIDCWKSIYNDKTGEYQKTFKVYHVYYMNV